jgi:hypothetical protein
MLAQKLIGVSLNQSFSSRSEMSATSPTLDAIALSAEIAAARLALNGALVYSATGAVDPQRRSVTRRKQIIPTASIEFSE